MDNLCHTLTGAALAEAGLKQRTRFGTAALLIASNLPDIDVLAFAADTPAVALRRGWTHGVLAQAVLPIILTGAFVLIGKWRPAHGANAPSLRPLTLLTLCYAGVLLHVAMDWLNTYGVRLLMPVSDRWFYGDAVFIVDPWLWLILAAGVAFARRRKRPRIAGTALGVAAVYVFLMVASSAAARTRVVDAWTAAKGAPPARLMVGPAPVNAFRKNVIIDAGDRYELGSFRWWPASVRFDPQQVPKNDRHPAAVRATGEDPLFRGILVWSRFPYYEITPVTGGTSVTLGDMRFRGRGMFRATRQIPSSGHATTSWRFEKCSSGAIAGRRTPAASAMVLTDDSSSAGCSGHGR